MSESEFVLAAIERLDSLLGTLYTVNQTSDMEGLCNHAEEALDNLINYIEDKTMSIRLANAGDE